MRERAWRLAGQALWVALAVCALLVATPWQGRWHFALDILSNFQIQYTVFSVLLLVCAVGLRRWHAAIVGLGLVVLLCARTFGVHGATPPPQDGISLKIVSANLLYTNRNSDGLLAFIAAKDPEVIALQEFGPGVSDALNAALLPKYPYAFTTPEPNPSGVALYSKLPCDLTPLDKLDARLVAGVSSFPRVINRFRLTVGGKPVTLYNVHPYPPAGARGQEERNAQLRLIADLVATEKGPVVVAGDLNATPWCPNYTDFIRTSGLHSGRDGHGPVPTWPARGIVPGFPAAVRDIVRIPIDYVFCSRELGFRDFHRGPTIGSDHLPLYAEVVLP